MKRLFLLIFCFLSNTIPMELPSSIPASINEYCLGSACKTVEVVIGRNGIKLLRELSKGGQFLPEDEFKQKFMNELGIMHRMQSFALQGFQFMYNHPVLTISVAAIGGTLAYGRYGKIKLTRRLKARENERVQEYYQEETRLIDDNIKEVKQFGVEVKQKVSNVKDEVQKLGKKIESTKELVDGYYATRIEQSREIKNDLSECSSLIDRLCITLDQENNKIEQNIIGNYKTMRDCIKQKCREISVSNLYDTLQNSRTISNMMITNENIIGSILQKLDTSRSQRMILQLVNQLSANIENLSESMNKVDSAIAVLNALPLTLQSQILPIHPSDLNQS